MRVRATHVIGNALRDAWLGNRWLTPEDVVKDLAKHGWYLVRVERVVTEEEPGIPCLPNLVERIEADVEADGIYDVYFRVNRQLLEQAKDAEKILGWQRRDSIIKLALEIAKRKGWLDESAG